MGTATATAAHGSTDIEGMVGGGLSSFLFRLLRRPKQLILWTIGVKGLRELIRGSTQPILEQYENRINKSSSYFDLAASIVF